MLAVALLSQFCQLHRGFCVGTVGSKRVVPVDHQPLELLRFAAGRRKGKGLAWCPRCRKRHLTAPMHRRQHICHPALLPAGAHLRRDFFCLRWPPLPPPLPRFLAAVTTARRCRPTGALHVLVRDPERCGAAQVGCKALLAAAWLRPGATAARRNAAVLDIACKAVRNVKLCRRWPLRCALRRGRAGRGCKVAAGRYFGSPISRSPPPANLYAVSAAPADLFAPSARLSPRNRFRRAAQPPADVVRDDRSSSHPSAVQMGLGAPRRRRRHPPAASAAAAPCSGGQPAAAARPGQLPQVRVGR